MDVENAILRKEKTRAMKRKKKEARIAKSKELDLIIRQRRMSRSDFSQNLLLDLSIQALNNFYERAVKEIEEFWDVFHQVGDLPDEMILPESNS